MKKASKLDMIEEEKILRNYLSRPIGKAILLIVRYDVQYVERYISNLLTQQFKNMRLDTFLYFKKTILDLVWYCNRYETSKREFYLENYIHFLDNLLVGLVDSFINLKNTDPSIYRALSRNGEAKIKVPLWYFCFLSLNSSCLDMLIRQQRYEIFWNELCHFLEKVKLRNQVGEWKNKYSQVYQEFEKFKNEIKYIERGNDLAKSSYLFHFDGENWRINYDSNSLPHLPDWIGFFYIQTLLKSPNQYVISVKLEQLRIGALPESFSKPYDKMSKDELGKLGLSKGYKQFARKNSRRKPHFKSTSDIEARANELWEDLREAKSNNDQASEQRISEELEYLANEFIAESGLGADNYSRTNVQKAIKRALDKIKTHNSDLFDHLKSSIETSHTCCYSPAKPLPWQF